MSCFSKSTYAILLLAAGLAIVLACGGGSSNSTSSSGVPVDEVITYRTMTGTLAEASNSVPGEALEATYRLSDINRIKCVDHLGNTYVSSVENGEFSINLPAGWSYTIAFLVNNDFAASLYYDEKHWFKMQDKPGKHLALGQVRIDIDIQRGTPENDPWEGADPEGTSPWEDANNDGIPDIFKNPHNNNDNDDNNDDDDDDDDDNQIEELTISTVNLPDIPIGIPYTTELSASGGVEPYTWALTVGSLPDGLALDTSTGIISGMTTTYGSADVTFRVTDSRGISSSRDFSIIILTNGITLTTDSHLPNATNGSAYTFILEASGDPGPYTWTVTAGALPNGMTLDASTGTISGTPIAVESQTFTVRASNGTVANSKDFTLVVTSANTWTATSTGANCPGGRHAHTAVWTGTEMIVWGGHDGVATPLNNGGRYNSEADTWQTTSTGANCPSVRWSHTAIWTGSKMIVWGGQDAGGKLNTGGIYDPATDTWAATSTGANCPTARDGHRAVWTGSKMIVWGGWDGAVALNTGGIYDPATDTWTATSTGANCPAIRCLFGAEWTGSKMVVWGGWNGTNPGDNTAANKYNTGGMYDPATDTWVTTSTGANCPEAKAEIISTWTGSKFIIWGGWFQSKVGGIYDPIADTWAATSTIGNCPAARKYHAGIWAGNRLVIWGGNDVAWYNTGGVYDIATDSWIATSTGANCPSIRGLHTIVWTGAKVVVWGGNTGAASFNTGGVFTP